MSRNPGGSFGNLSFNSECTQNSEMGPTISISKANGKAIRKVTDEVSIKSVSRDKHAMKSSYKNLLNNIGPVGSNKDKKAMEMFRNIAVWTEYEWGDPKDTVQIVSDIS